jgi:hypothetical protein
MKIVKDTNNNIISGTEVAYQKNDKPTEEEKKTFQDKWKAHKEEYITKHSVEEMVYENGSALALLYKEITRLNDLLTNTLKQNGNKEEN